MEAQIISAPLSTDLRERALGALMGAFIGDALGVGPHWYYDLKQLQADYGAWIDTYTRPRPERYHAGLEPGQSSQSGILLEMMLRSLVDRGGYDETDFCRRLDKTLFPRLDGTPMHGPGGYTSQSIRDAWRKRVNEGQPWGCIAGPADNTEAAERIIALAVRLALTPGELARAVWANTQLLQDDSHVLSMTTIYGAVLGMLVEGHRLDAALSAKLIARIEAEPWPDSGTHDTAAALDNEQKALRRAARIPSRERLMMPSDLARAAQDPGIHIEPAARIALLFGLPCAVHQVFPAVYYLAARFSDDFESAVLHAINGGGQNQARAMLTGALCGAMVGLSGIPTRLLQGLEHCATLLSLGDQLVAAMIGDGSRRIRAER